MTQLFSAWAKETDRPINLSTGCEFDGERNRMEADDHGKACRLIVDIIHAKALTPLPSCGIRTHALTFKDYTLPAWYPVIGMSNDARNA